MSTWHCAAKPRSTGADVIGISIARVTANMAAVDIDSLYARFASIDSEHADEELRRLTHDLLSVLVEKQAIVINLQRRAFTLSQAGSPDARLIQSHAEEAFAVVQRLNDLRRRVTTCRAANDHLSETGRPATRAGQRGVSLRHVSIRQRARAAASGR
jgi:hypothetical protein